MKFIKNFLLLIVLIALNNSAHAVIINFKAMAEAGGSHGESAWNPLTFSYSDFDLSITATQQGQDAYAYLDAGNGGLGVCGALYNAGSANQVTNSGANLCNPGNDDNVTFYESLFFVFSNDVTIERIWFNNNHDGDRSLLGDLINIDGAAYMFSNGGYMIDSYTTTPYTLAGGTIFDIAFNNEQYYVSAVEVTTSIPEPTSIALLGLGLLGVGLVRVRRML
ncbi:MAG: PEP-CTERM sorting domain-containing protein [Gammaproteobacteria bacterium]|nr:PEP-CTERM sorting domain-containing protein [Gammaproteobacteria bacterium]